MIVAIRSLFLAIACSVLAAVSSSAMAEEDCSCASALDKVAVAVRDNYAGYRLKLPKQHDREIHAQYLDLLKEDARGLEPAACRRVIARYLDFFADEHLFVLPPSKPSSKPRQAEAESTAVAVPTGRASGIETPEIPNLRAAWTPEKVEFRLRREANLDPIEGLWKDGKGEFAIVYDDAIPRGEYVAFRFERKFRIRPGKVFAFIRAVGDGSYLVRYQRDDEDWAEARANLTADGVLTFADKGWQRTTRPATQTGERPPAYVEEDEAEEEAQPSFAADPLAPQFRELSNGLYYLKLASFMPQYREPLNALIEEHGDTLSQARGLIIDVRGNGGGDAIYFPLADWFLSGPIVVNEANAVLASDWNIQYFERFREQLGDRGGWLDPALARMRANRGEIVPYLDKRVEGPDNPQPGPRQIVVLQDSGVGSAAEAFLLHARQSDKVVTMGEPSKGNIDYQQVNIRTLQCGDYSVNFGWPLYMRSRDLPRDSLDDSGVPPDVRLAPDADWMQYAERWLRAATE
jgi:hypothetical protein